MRVFKLSVVMLITLVSLSSFMNFHKYYVSVTDIEYANETKSLQVISELSKSEYMKNTNLSVDLNLRMSYHPHDSV